MRGPTRVAAAGITAAAACVLLFVGAVSAPAAGPPIESYQATGEARGFDIAFTFQGSIFERLLDLGMPHARSSVSSEGGSASRGTAAQLFPGDLVIGAAGEQFPGYRQAVYPREQATDVPDDSHVSDTFRIPGVIPAGPLSVDTGHIVTTASANEASGRATTNVVALTPLIRVASLDTLSASKRLLDRVEHDAQTIVGGISIELSKDLTVSIGKLVSSAHTSSDGLAPVAETSLKMSDVEVVMAGTSYRATIDEKGISITGLTKDSAVVPQFVPQDVNQALQVILDQANVRIATAQGTKTVEDVSADASLSGLLVTFTGTVPNVFVPDVVSQLLYEQVLPNLPKEVQEALTRSICLEGDVKPLLPKELTENLPAIPLCFSPQVVPGPGSGTVTTFSIGAVRSLSVAVQATSIGGPTDDGFVDGGFIPEPPVALGPPTDGGFTQPPPAVNPPAGPAPVLTGLVAVLPSWSLLLSGGVFLILAMILAMGPSLRTWRATQKP